MVEESVRAKRETLLVALLLVVGSLAILYPFLDAIVLAVATSYLLGFTHQKLSKHVKSDLLSNTIIISSLIGFVSLGLYFFIDNIYEIIGSLNTFAISLEDRTVSILESLNLPEYVITEVSGFFQFASNYASDELLGIIFSLPSFLINLAIFLVTAIYLYKDRGRISRGLYSILEDLPDTEERIMRSLMESVDSIFKGVFITQIVVALILGVVAGIGFYLIGLLTTPIPLVPLWAFFIAVAAILPLVAAFMFYAPLGAYYILSAQPLKGSLIILFGVVFLQVMPEVVLRPWVGAKSLNEHPLIVFTGFLAGPLVLGVKGVILGPLMLILTKEFILDYADLFSSEE
ncbi:MAG: AI-2E family transporter [Candidatus Nanohaloarchaea archaeon]